MKNHKKLLIIGLLLVPGFAFGACSVTNLTRCLDSACAINIGANPAARCQYCGSSSAGEPATAGLMKTVTAGSAAKFVISDKELKKAPTDPGERYIWASKLCLKKMDGCTTEDIEDNYDALIEQSCKAAGISAEMASLAKEINEEKSQASCSTEISTCIINTNHCLADYRNCESDADFDKFFSECNIAAIGCDAYSKDIRSKLMAARDSAIKNADKALQSIVDAYRKAREQKLNNTIQSCRDNSAKQSCIDSVCATSMRNKCEAGFENETAMAEQLCKFYDIACSRLQ